MITISRHTVTSHSFSLLLTLIISIHYFFFLQDQSWALGTLQGHVRDGAGFAIPGALVSSSEGSTDVTGSNGLYKMAHSAGSTYTVTASATGYEEKSFENIIVTDDQTTFCDFYLAGSPLQIKTAYPNLGKLGQPLKNIISQGINFDQNSRLSMYLDTENKVKIIRSIETPGDAVDVAVKGNMAYVADGTSGLQIIDVSNPEAPEIKGWVDTQGYAQGVSVKGGTAYVADGTNGLKIIDISNPGTAAIIQEVSTPDEARDVTVVENMAYVAAGLTGLQVIDVSDPEAPELKGSVDTPHHAQAVTVKNDIAYIADHIGGLQIIDLTKLSEPDPIIGTVDTPGWALAVVVIENKAYVADGWEGLQIIELGASEPGFHSIIGTVDTPGFAQGLFVVGNTAYVADETFGLQVIDVNPQSDNYLKIIGSVDTPVSASAVNVIGGIAFVGDMNGLEIIDISNPALANNIGLIETGSAQALTIIGSRAYVADSVYGLKVIDISTPSAPKIIGSIDTPGQAMDVKVINNRAYVADLGGGLQIIDVSNSAGLSIIGWIDTTVNEAVAVTVVDSNAYVADYFVADSEGAMHIIDVSDPEHPNLVNSVPTPAGVGDIVVNESIAYLANGPSGLQIIDLTKLSEPDPIIGTVETDDARGITVVGNTAYVADGESGLRVINVSDPEQPDIICSVDTPGLAQAVTVIGDTAYVADYVNGIQMIDVTACAQSVIIGSVGTEFAADISVDGKTAYVAAEHKGFVIVPVPVEVTDFSVTSTTSLTATLPSPMIKGNYTLRVFNNGEYDELLGAVTFTDDIDLLTSKAIIVAGGGPEASGDIWEEIKAYANYAYESLIYQGYLDEDIYYLTDETGAPGRDVSATRENLKHAITQWTTIDSDTSGLLIYLVDHGASEEFQIRGGTDMQNVSAFELDSWLDTLQKTMKGKVVFIYDACKSGSFISTDSSAAGTGGNFLVSSPNPPEGSFREELLSSEVNPVSIVPETVSTVESNTQSSGDGNTFLPAIFLLLNASSGDQDRVMITSSGSNQVSYFLNPSHSFSFHFWSTLSGKTGNKANLPEAFAEASSTMSLYQTAQLDANGNGKANEDEDFSTLQEFEGKIYALRRQYSSDLTKPVVGIVSDDQTLQSESSATLLARSVYDIDGDRIDRVWAEIIRPDFNPHQGNLTVTDIPTVELTDIDDNRVYEGNYTSFDVEGAYIINFYAEDAHGVYSQPKTSLVIKE